MSNCVFCKIVNKEIPAKIVFENDNILAFEDVTPQAPVHFLLIPKKHIPGLNDATTIDSVLLAELLSVAKELAKKYRVDQKGYRLNLNVGPDAGQTVAHIHFHLLGGRKFDWPPG